MSTIVRGLDSINSDQLNTAFMVMSLVVAYYVPVELVLLSYAFLGPAHYLTQISWMHDRQYFVASRAFPYIFVILGIVYTLLIYTPMADLTFYADIMFIGLALAASMIFQKPWHWRLCLFAFLFFIYMALSLLTFEIVMITAILLPTVIHIFVFTWFFMISGAIRNPNLFSVLSCVLLPLCGVAFFVWEPEQIVYNRQFAEQNLMFFYPLVDYMMSLARRMGGETHQLSVLGFLSFAYTYHYLNWFSKVNVIRWNQISNSRLACIVVLYFMSVGLYFYDYKTGFVALVFLSILHVLFEFPLNIKTVGFVLGKVNWVGVKRLKSGS